MRDQPIKMFGNNSAQAHESQRKLHDISKELDILLWSDVTNDIWYYYTEEDIKDIEKLCNEGIRHLKEIKKEINDYKKNPLNS